MKKVIFFLTQIILIFLVILSSGYFYNQSLDNKWAVRYKISMSDEAEIYFSALDTLLIRLNLVRSIDKKFINRMEKNYQNYSSQIIIPNNISNLRVTKSEIFIETNNKNKIEDDISFIVNELNKYLIQDLETKLKIYSSYAKQILQDEIKFTLGQIDKFQLVAENSNKIVTNNQKNNNKKKLDNLNNLKLEEKIFLEGLISQLYDENISGLNVKQLIKIFDTYSISKSLENIEFLRNTYIESNPHDNIDLITIERMTLDLNKINFVIGVSITDIVNKKPSLKQTMFAFLLLSIFISLAYTYLHLLNARIPILERIKVLLNLK